MNVLHVVPNLRDGGPGHLVSDLCAALAGEGVGTTICGLHAGDDAAASAVRLPSWRGSAIYPGAGFSRQIRPLVEASNLVHLHGLWSPAIALTARICRETVTPYIVTAHGMLDETGRQRHAARKWLYHAVVERRTLGGAAALHFLTTEELRRSRVDARDGQAIVVVPNGIDPDLRSRVAAGRFVARYPRLAGSQVVVTIGRLHWSKGLALQCEAMALLAHDLPRLQWLLIGPDQGEWRSLAAQAARLGIRDRLLWTGRLPRHECLEALRDSDVYLQTSRHEAQSIAMIEALALACPVVISETLAYPELARYEASVRAAPDAPAVAAGVRAVLSDENLRTRLRSAGVRLVGDQLAWPVVAPRMVELYQRTIPPEGPRRHRRLHCKDHSDDFSRARAPLE